MENLKKLFEKAKEVLHPANTKATYDDKLKAIQDLGKVFSILYE